MSLDVLLEWPGIDGQLPIFSIIVSQVWMAGC